VLLKIFLSVPIFTVLVALLAGCLGSPQGVVAIDGFDKQR
jgi:hypothetical protein